MAANTQDTADAPADTDWITVEVDFDDDKLDKQRSKLERCYPERYDIRITPIEGAGAFELAIRHRD